MTYGTLSLLEAKLSRALKALQRAEQRIEDDCCASHGLSEVAEATELVKEAHVTIASDMLDALRAETRSAP